MALKSLADVQSDRSALVRTAYMSSDLRLQALELLTARYGLDATISFVLELGGMLLTRADIDETKPLSLVTVLQRTLGADWKEIFSVVGTVAFRILTWKEWLEAEEDVRLFLGAKPKTRVEKKRADRVGSVARRLGVA